MTSLQMIADTAQQVAEAISAALGVETEIVDEELTIVAGTGNYLQMIGNKDYEAIYPDSPFLYGRVLRTGESFIIEDVENNEIYGPNPLGEMCEICCPITLNNRIIGVIALVAFNQIQSESLLQKRDILQHFLKHMALLLANTVSATQAYKKLKISSNLLEIMVDSFTAGVISLDSEGRVTHCNSRAAKIIGVNEDELRNRPIEEFLPNSPVLQVLKTGEGYRNREEFYGSPPHDMHLLVSTVPILVDGHPSGVVLTFSEMAEARQLAYQLTDTHHDLHFNYIIGKSKLISTVKEQAFQVARGSSSILITGESGTGKELFARAIHYASPRRDKPLIIVNCGAIPETLLESELFGYEEGAFTGARKGGRPGKFELADGGTVFLDEIGDLPLHLQVKLLHVLQRRQVERVGGTKVIPINVRVIAATNRDLEAMCAAGEFREDLYYRLSVIPLVIPPLRERREDIPELIDHFLLKYCTLLEKQLQGYTEEVKNVLLSYHWPGNVRELENSIEYAVNMENQTFIKLKSLPVRLLRDNQSEMARPNYNLFDATCQTEKAIISELLGIAARGTISFQEIPQLLGISRATFYRKLKTYQLSHLNVTS